MTLKSKAPARSGGGFHDHSAEPAWLAEEPCGRSSRLGEPSSAYGDCLPTIGRPAAVAAGAPLLR